MYEMVIQKHMAIIFVLGEARPGRMKFNIFSLVFFVLKKVPTFIKSATFENFSDLYLIRTQLGIYKAVFNHNFHFYIWHFDFLF